MVVPKGTNGAAPSAIALTPAFAGEVVPDQLGIFQCDIELLTGMREKQKALSEQPQVPLSVHGLSTTRLLLIY